MAVTTLLIKSKKDDFGTRKKSHAQNSYTVNRLFEKVLMPFSECTLVRIQDMKKYTLVRDHPHSSALLLIRTNKLFIALSLKGKLFPKKRTYRIYKTHAGICTFRKHCYNTFDLLNLPASSLKCIYQPHLK